MESWKGSGSAERAFPTGWCTPSLRRGKKDQQSISVCSHKQASSCKRQTTDLVRLRYNILAAEIMNKAKTDKAAAKGLFDLVGLEAEKYRLGHTKASCFLSFFSTVCPEGSELRIFQRDYGVLSFHFTLFNSNDFLLAKLFRPSTIGLSLCFVTRFLFDN